MMAIMTAASAAASHVSQQQAAKAQTQHQQSLMKAEQERQRQAETNLRLRQQDEQEARTRELSKVAQEARSMYARNVTAAGEAGISGASVDALLAEGTWRELDFYESMDRQGQIQNTAYEREIEAGRTGSEMRILDVNRAVSKPSFANLAINLGMAGMQTHDFAQRKYQIDTQGIPASQRADFSFTDSVSGRQKLRK
tara:strand:+ start:6709 stop:7299 length:591 start_codon:yes stop_codon:yes gene_type:complete